MPKTSTESVNPTVTTSQPVPNTPKDTATIFNPAKPTATPAQRSTDSSDPYHHKANHNQNRSIEQSSQVTSTTSATINAPVNTAPKIGFVSLGCPKALVDSERIITELSRDGYQVASDYDGADLVVVNTCGFIESAVQESLDAIGEAISKNGKVIVTGCLGKEAEKIRTMHPAVLAVTGAHAYDEVITAVSQHVPRPNKAQDKDYNPKIDLINEAGIKLTPSHYAYLKISEGCNHRCTFCIIPSLRGDLVSRPIDSVMNEALALKKAGVKELLIISQDTSAYGLDLKYKTSFWNGMPLKSKFYDMCKALNDLGIWVRLHYVYPYPHVDKVVELMGEKKLLPYLDIPFQHASHRILKAMKRPAHSENTLARIKAWREICPDIVIRSTFVVGFPGETEEDFQVLLDWLVEAGLDRVGAFTYSEVEGAVANDLPNPVPENIKQERYERFMSVQQEISAQKLQEKIGKTLMVLVDEIDSEEGIAICRSYADAPEIDGHVYVDEIDGHVKVGQFLTVTIDDASEYDLFASYQG
ncbi:30S ribosomal protein S12 methylthiotransferase RimO [Psychrobacter sp. AOP22-C1-22]|uniref:30S ribosomal protein S12 methylthiotransferase RimO n=1 Tax=unclassified Psychrobacter TaxID=196806 RepID=UPI00178781DF|nr:MULTISPECIES: 30S ribosomal protein S12 methylthiotransferase RimO [unclassified Psychrobacter]MBE0406255.1 30S ribosomal protein S12 methylthiotransferase RimO [Psychrobacter sp. FME6]MBE0444634.1 30S ribosomal protein S12 methylthiotransferase RimO [Psychrobacter sp. FME5]MDN5801105.1 30S ribosomal protein S12 methylthiotransferase RimO [Psychrobacter sp.]